MPAKFSLEVTQLFTLLLRNAASNRCKPAFPAYEKRYYLCKPSPTNMRLLTYFLLLSLAFPVVAEEEIFDVVLPTSRKDSSKRGALRVLKKGVPLRELPNLLKEHGQILPNQFAEAPHVTVYVPSNFTNEQVREVLQLSHQAFSDIPSEEEIRIEVNVLGERSVPALAEEGRVFLDKLADRLPKGDPRARVVEFLREKLQFVEGESAEDSPPSPLSEKLVRPRLVRKVVGFISAGRALSVLGLRGTQVWHGRGASNGVAAAGAALVVGDTLAEFLTVKFQQELGDLFERHGIPFRDRYEFLTLCDDVYRNSEFAQFGKGAAANMILMVLGRNLALQYLAHAYNPQQVSAVTRHDVVNLAINGSKGTTFYGGGRIGSKLLKDKLWLRRSELDWLFRLLGLIDVPVNYFNSRPELRHHREKFQQVQWGAYAAMLAAGIALPARNHRFVLFHQGLTEQDRKDVDALEHIGELEELSPQSMERIRQAPAISRRDFCWRALKFFARSTSTAYRTP